MSRVLLLLLLLLAPAMPETLPEPSPPKPPTVDLAHATWTRNGVAPSSAPAVSDGQAGSDGPAVVVLPIDALGVRWACEFRTEAGATRRLQLGWRGGPDGLLFEVVLDGTRLSPPRDGWRPTPRALHSDLGPVWLAPGAHLLELVAREQPPEGGARLAVGSLELGEP